MFTGYDHNGSEDNLVDPKHHRHNLFRNGLKWEIEKEWNSANRKN